MERLKRTLESLALRDRIVFVHSSWSALSSTAESWRAVIQLLCDSVGSGGTLVMPAYPMRGLSQEHLVSHPFFDCRRTPSQSGLITEIFRRLRGVCRSVHPTHSVAAWGALASQLTTGHQRAATPFDGFSPFQRMYDEGALVLDLGVQRITFRHLADHLIRYELPHDVYADRVVRVRLIDCEGVESWMETRGHNPRITCNHRVVLDLMRERALRRPADSEQGCSSAGTGMVSRDVGGVPVELIPVQPYVAFYHRCYHEGLLRFFPRGGAEAGSSP